MKIELLRTFLEVSRTLHFRLASESLFITQSAVSARIKLLEDDLGVRLFDRRHKHLKLTPEGHRLIKHANEILFMWKKAKQDVGMTEQNSLQLVIGSIMSIWDIILQNWLQKIHLNMEEISLLTTTYSPLELRKTVLNGVVDIAFLFEPPFVEELITEKVATIPLHLVSSEPGFNIKEQNLNNYVMVDYGASVNAQHMREFKNAPPAKHVIDQPRVALEYILEAGGSAYLPRQMVFEHIQKKKLYLIEDAPVYFREVFAIYLSKSHKAKVIAQAIQYFPDVAF